MFHIYKTINKLNGKYYIGVSNGNNPWYKGSGTALKRAIKKYGGENFEVTILETFSCEDDMYSREEEIVNESLVNDPMSYNCKLGGRGGRGSKRTEEHKQNISKSLKEKQRLGLIQNNGGRKQKTPYHEIIALVNQYGIVEAAKVLGESYHTFRSRYYTAKKKLTNNT